MAEERVVTVGSETLHFPNGNTARLVKANPADRIDDLLAALTISPARAVMLVVGGADKVSDEIEEQCKPRLKQVFSRAIVRAAVESGAVILDGGTQSGVMEWLGAGVASNGARIPLLGVAPANRVTYPGHEDGSGKDPAPLDPNHTHFLLAPGDTWGIETPWLIQAAEALSDGKPVLTVLVNGGPVAKSEVLESVRRGWPVLVIRGSGGLADQIAGLDGPSPNPTLDPDLSEIQADGRISVVGIDDLSEIERVIAGRSPQDQTLPLAWQLFNEYDASAKRCQGTFRGLQMLILTLGVLATALAIVHQREPVEGDWIGRVLQDAIIMIPILISILIAWVNRFRPGNKWVLLRAEAEAMKREIFRYRAQAGAYSAAQCRDIPREMKLAQEMESISARLQRTEVNRSVIPPIRESALPKLDMLSPEDYVRERLQDQIEYMRSKTGKLERSLQVWQWAVLLLGGAGTLLAAIGRNVWIALTVAIAAAITTKLETDQVENSLIQYNQALAGLVGVQGWWTALTEWEKHCQKNIDLLVDHTEKILEGETSGWVQQMQSALEKLRQQQTQREPDSGKVP